MAINPNTRYPGQTDTTDPTGYPYGKARNIVTPGDGTGTPYERDVVSDIWGFFQALLGAASIVPSGTPDKVGASQYLTAIQGLIANVSLQAAYLRSVALSQIAPHIDVATASLQVGGTADAMLFRVVNSTQTTTAKILAVLGTTTLPSVASLLITGAGAGGVQKALTQTSGVGGEIALSGGAWDPVTSAVAATGTNASTTDVSFGKGGWVRVGDRIPFALSFSLDTTGYTASDYTFDFTLPVASNLSNSDVQATAQLWDAGGVPNHSVEAYANTASDRLQVAFTWTGATIACTIKVTGFYTVI